MTKSKRSSGQVTLEPNTTEYEIAVKQLERLKEISDQRMFTSEEAKLYDILVKNITLSKNGQDQGGPTYRVIKDEHVEDLVKMIQETAPLTIEQLIKKSEEN